MVSTTLQEAVDGWSASADTLLRVAQAAAPLQPDDLQSLSLQVPEVVGAEEGTGTATGPTRHVTAETFNSQVEEFIDSSEAVIHSVMLEAPTREDGASRAVAVLIGNMEVAQVLMVAGDEPDAAVASFGVTETSMMDLAASRSVLDELRATLFGEPPPGTPLPTALGEGLEKLEVAGAKEMGELLQDALMRAALGGAVSGLEVLDRSGTLKKAFDGVRKHLHAIREAAVRLTQWALERLYRLVPEKFRKQFDEKLEDLKKGLLDEVGDVLTNTVGFVFGRRDVEFAWQKAIDDGVDMTNLLPRVGSIIDAHTHRIGQISRLRTAATTVAALITAVAAAAAAHVQVIIGALALLVLAVVGYQMWDGFNDVQSLIPAP